MGECNYRWLPSPFLPCPALSIPMHPFSPCPTPVMAVAFCPVVSCLQGHACPPLHAPPSPPHCTLPILHWSTWGSMHNFPVLDQHLRTRNPIIMWVAQWVLPSTVQWWCTRTHGHISTYQTSPHTLVIQKTTSFNIIIVYAWFQTMVSTEVTVLSTKHHVLLN